MNFLKISAEEWKCIGAVVFVCSLLMGGIASTVLGNNGVDNMYLSVFIAVSLGGFVTFSVTAVTYHIWARGAGVVDSKSYVKAGCVAGMLAGALIFGAGMLLGPSDYFGSGIVFSAVFGGGLSGLICGSLCSYTFYAFVVFEGRSLKIRATALWLLFSFPAWSSLMISLFYHPH